jgi:hypothetical protein
MRDGAAKVIADAVAVFGSRLKTRHAFLRAHRFVGCLEAGRICASGSRGHVDQALRRGQRRLRDRATDMISGFPAALGSRLSL